MTDLDEDLWHAWRRGDDLPDGETAVTGSVIAQCDSGAYGGAYAAQAKRQGLLADDIDPYLANRGHTWEHAIAQMVHLCTGLHVVGEQALVQHPEHTWMRHTTDGFLAPVDPAGADDLTALLEIKTRSAQARPTDTTWAYWRAQVQWGMLVAGLPSAVLAVASIDDITGQCVGIRIHQIDADYGHQIRLQHVADDYRWHYAQSTLPIRTDADLDHVKAVGPANYSEDDVALDTIDDQDWDELLRLHTEAKAEAAEAEKARKYLEAQILQSLRSIEATSGTTETGWRVNLGEPARILTAEAKAALVDAYPELGETVFIGTKRANQTHRDQIEAARTPNGARRLTITPPKEPS